MTQTATSPQRKPLLDEASFQQLLSAAYVLQEHNDSLRDKESQAEVAKNLSVIVETQKLIQTLQLDLTAAAALVAERVQKIANASGSAIGFLEKGELFYRAGTGIAGTEAGKQVALDSALSSDCLVKNCVLHYSDVDTLAPARAKLFRDQDVKAFIAVPVYHAGQVAGVLELRFAAGSFREADVRTAELMAGLLGEALATNARLKWKEALASERQSMLEALERIKPQLERLGNESPTIEEKAASESPVATVATKAITEASSLRSTDRCSVCGSDFFDPTESFCGICGAARAAVSRLKDHRTSPPLIVPYADENPPIERLPIDRTRRAESADPAGNMPASLQELIELCATQTNATASGTGQFENSAPSADPAGAPESKISKIALEQDSTRTSGPASIFSIEDNNPPAQFQALIEGQAAATQGEALLRIFPAELAPPPPENVAPYPWSSARKAQQWLEAVKVEGPAALWLAHQWQRRRANIYIGIAVLILLVVISGWGFRPAATTSAANTPSAAFGRHQKPPDPQLTPFEKLLVSIGLAEAPPAPVYSGNPDTQVWVDVHTALYYCPGSEFYGKTPDGRFTTQRDAQQDQFEPANRKACP